MKQEWVVARLEARQKGRRGEISILLVPYCYLRNMFYQRKRKGLLKL